MNKVLTKRTRKLLLIIIGFFFLIQVKAQPCTTLGQNPQTAFPVCGTSVFTQTTVPVCGVRSVPSPCSQGPYEDKNPFWYKFTCFASGTLSFTISPLGDNEDYDWQLFDITGRSASEVFTNPTLLVASNWTAEFGNTGASSAGSTLILCDGPGIANFTSMPTLITGHDYILLVSHFSNTQSGYTLSFGGGSAVITDPLEPHLVEASAFCDGTQITIKLNKEMRCNSIAANGSDFKINTALSSIISAVGNNCSTSFEVESVTLTLNNPLPAGDYIISIKNGSDGNTLKDICDRNIPENESVPVTIYPIFPTPLDSLTKPKCAPDKLELVFSKPIRCSSIDANGSDFKVTGSYPVIVTAASGECEDGLTKKIIVSLSQPLFTAGSFRIELINNIIDECGSITPIGQFLNFNLKDTVSADFTAQQIIGCILDTINYSHNAGHGVNQWQWVFDRDRMSSVRNPQIYYSSPGPKETTLNVSNGFCSSTITKTITLPEKIKAAFEATEFVCPDDLEIINNLSSGEIVSWAWDFGNGVRSTLKNPPAQSYGAVTENSIIKILLTVKDAKGCIDTASQFITVVDNCLIAVPSAFTPNGDGLNDFLYPLNAYKATNLSFSVYNRFGERVFFTRSWLDKWDGKFKRKDADPGAYVWILSYIDSDSNKAIFKRGSVILIR